MPMWQHDVGHLLAGRDILPRRKGTMSISGREEYFADILTPSLFGVPPSTDLVTGRAAHFNRIMWSAGSCMNYVFADKSALAGHFAGKTWFTLFPL